MCFEDNFWRNVSTKIFCLWQNTAQPKLNWNSWTFAFAVQKRRFYSQFMLSIIVEFHFNLKLLTTINCTYTYKNNQHTIKTLAFYKNVSKNWLASPEPHIIYHTFHFVICIFVRMRKTEAISRKQYDHFPLTNGAVCAQNWNNISFYSATLHNQLNNDKYKLTLAWITSASFGSA